MYVGHSEAVQVEFSEPISAEEAKDILAQAPGVEVMDDPGASLYPYPWLSAGRDVIFAPFKKRPALMLSLTILPVLLWSAVLTRRGVR